MQYVSCRHGGLCAIQVERNVGHRQVGGDTGPVAGPRGVHRGDGGNVNEVHVVYDGLHLVDVVLDLVELRHVEGGLVVEVDGVGHPTDREVLDVGRLGAENSDDFVLLF